LTGEVELSSEHLDLNLLDKTEIWIKGIKLEKVDLREVAKAVAQVLGLRENEVLVVDVRDDVVVLDILRKTIKAENVVGKEKEILNKLRTVEGVTLYLGASVHSEGILGLISLDEEATRQLLTSLKEVGRKVVEKVSKRVLVFSTGFELKQGMVKDTNFEVIKELLSKHKYAVKYGGILDDDEDLIAGAIRKAVDEGYGLIVITGGTGAEDKDRTIEGLRKVDPTVATECITRFKKGSGRHVKECVQIGVGQLGTSLIIALPGPTDEVKESLEPLLEGLARNLDKRLLAKAIAEKLRERLLERMRLLR
jgi:molybdenum cofactor synthesis domain-containing protein